MQALALQRAYICSLRLETFCMCVFSRFEKSYVMFLIHRKSLNPLHLGVFKCAEINQLWPLIL